MIKADLHVHSLASGHALNSVYELVANAKQKELDILGITEHGPNMQGAPHDGYFWISNQIKEISGIKVLLGIEANIINLSGEIDLPIELLRNQQIVSAGIHSRTSYKFNQSSNNTEAIINAMVNPYVKIIVHPYRCNFPVDIEKVTLEACKYNTLLEVNNSIFEEDNVPELLHQYSRMIAICNKNNMPVILGSDAHVAEKIGDFSRIFKYWNDLGLKKELILNYYPEQIIKFLQS